MKNGFFVASIIALAVAATGCVALESDSTRVSPTAPTLTSVPSGSAGALTGMWASDQPLDVSSWSCGSFQWSISEQTSNSLSGEFYAVCAGIVLIHGTASGQLNGNDVPLQVSGTATAQGILSCPFTLTGIGHIQGNDAIRIEYTGTTCLGPLEGEETLHRPASPNPEPPSVPDPEPEPPAASENPNHVGPGALSRARAEAVVHATGREFPHLTAAPGSEAEGVHRAEELLLRTIWHLQLAGFDAARQRNPSGAISNDKLTVFVDGGWRAFDIFYDLGHPGVPMQTIFFEVFPASPLAYPGIPD